MPDHDHQDDKHSNDEKIKTIYIPVAVIGSSGGGAATLGHTNPSELLSTIHRELGRIKVFPNNKNDDDDDNEDDECATTKKHRYILGYALFVSLHGGKGLDSADLDTSVATLYSVNCFNHNNHNDTTPNQSNLQIKSILTGTLREINQKCQHYDKTILSPLITNHEIAGLISISSDPLVVHHFSFLAAAKSNIPVTGSGGSSLSMATTMHHITLVGNAGGSVATTTYTRAVSYCYALATAWTEKANVEKNKYCCRYSPFYPSANEDGEGVHHHHPSLRSVLDACLPAFMAVCVLCHVLKYFISIGSKEDDNDDDWKQKLLYQLQYHTLPSVCCIITASTYTPSQHGSSSTVLMASTIASFSCTGSVLCGLLAGWMVSWLVGRCLFACIRCGIPATMTNILVAGGVGASVALLLGGTGIVSFLCDISECIRYTIQVSPRGIIGRYNNINNTIGYSSFSSSVMTWWDGKGIGCLLGIVFCYGSKIGWYHTIFLPLILIEMERGDASILGAVDECTLVMVSAGICAANILTTKKHDLSSISKRGIWINLLYGDFIEAAYPFMEKSWIINGSAYVASIIICFLAFITQAYTTRMHTRNNTHTDS